MDIIEKIFELLWDSASTPYLCLVSRHTLRFTRQLLYRAITISLPLPANSLFPASVLLRKDYAVVYALQSLQLNRSPAAASVGVLSPLQHLTFNVGLSSLDSSENPSYDLCMAIIHYAKRYFRILDMTNISIQQIPDRLRLSRLKYIAFRYSAPFRAPEHLIFWIQNLAMNGTVLSKLILVTPTGLSPTTVWTMLYRVIPRLRVVHLAIGGALNHASDRSVLLFWMSLFSCIETTYCFLQVHDITVRQSTSCFASCS